jgi:hypothetical protein
VAPGQQPRKAALGVGRVLDEERALLGAREQVAHDEEILLVAVDDEDPDDRPRLAAATPLRLARARRRAPVRAERDDGRGSADRGPAPEVGAGGLFRQPVGR